MLCVIIPQWQTQEEDEEKLDLFIKWIRAVCLLCLSLDIQRDVWTSLPPLWVMIIETLTRVKKDLKIQWQERYPNRKTDNWMGGTWDFDQCRPWKKKYIDKPLIVLWLSWKCERWPLKISRLRSSEFLNRYRRWSFTVTRFPSRREPSGIGEF